MQRIFPAFRLALLGLLLLAPALSRAATYHLALSNAAPWQNAGILTNGSCEGVATNWLTNAVNEVHDPYNAGVSITLEARSIPSSLIFSRWTGTLASDLSTLEAENPRITDFYLDRDGSLIANFTNKVNLTVSSANLAQGATIPVSGTSTGIPLGKPFAVTAIPAPQYDFWYWTNLSGSLSISNPVSAATHVTVTALGGAPHIRAWFRPRRLLQVVTLSGSGIVYLSSPSVPLSATNRGYFAEGETVTLTAYGIDGNEFKRWSPNVLDPFSATTFIILTNNAGVTVEFGPAGKKLVVLAAPHGTATPAGTNSYPVNTPVEIGAVADPGYAFAGWTRANGGPVDPAKRLLNPAFYIMDMDRDFMAHFTNACTLTVFNKQPGQGPYVLPPLAAGAYLAYEETNSTVLGPVFDSRYAITGWTGTGDVPPSGLGNRFEISAFSRDSTVSWEWQLQYMLRSSMTNIVLIMVEGYKPAGSTHPVSVDVPDGYKISYWLINGVMLLTNSPTIYVTMDGPKSIGTVFSQAGVDVDSDDDGMPDWYELEFGLDPNRGSGVDGRFGDPDRDGLGNYSEFLLTVTNAVIGAKFMNPSHCDSDGDGLDDGYEHTSFDVPRLINGGGGPGDPFVSAALLVTSPYGGGHNPDQDCWWDAADGYQKPGLPLLNADEYAGPDGAAPILYAVPPSEWALYFPGSADYPDRRKDLVVLLANPADTGDDSDPLEPDGDGDGFDDGYEFAWDRWQQAHQGEPVQDAWPAITAVVPPWPGQRRYHPRGVVSASADVLEPDYDWLYNPGNGAVDIPFDDYEECMASVTAASNRYPVVRSPGRWCTNPFRWDTDGDGLPDGWELAYGFNPWVAGNDAAANPDGDALAVSAGRYHREVFDADGFDPRAAWRPTPQGDNAFNNLLEFLGTAVLGTGDFHDAEPHWTRASAAASTNTNPRNVDSDVDGLFDGWELYLGLDPNQPDDALMNLDGPPEALVNWQEFMGAEVLAYWRDRIAAGATSNTILQAWSDFSASWPNKKWPTNPYDPDTDADQLRDDVEQTCFNYSAGAAGAGGGLDPCSVDTDLDYLPDAWEQAVAGARVAATNGAWVWTGGADGTRADALDDIDGDGLHAYQEYLVGACYQFQWMWNDGTVTLDDPAAGLRPGPEAYDPYDFFDVTLSLNDPLTGPGGLAPHGWDPAFFADRTRPPLARFKPFTFLGGIPTFDPRVIRFSTCHPGLADSDGDGFDDFYELYHCLNPIRGEQDAVTGKTGFDPLMSWLLPTVYELPFKFGELPVGPVADFDQDGQVDLEEGLTPGQPAVIPNHHTDPSPYFVADLSSPGSWVNQYYKTGDGFGARRLWYWNDSVLLDLHYPAAYLFSFEMNEGYDTDNDLVMDGVEVVGDTPGTTDPLSDDSPLRQRALYVDGAGSAARLYAPVLNPWTSFRAFTVEAWVKPAAIDGDRVVVERGGLLTSGNPGLPPDTAVHRNFRLGLTNGIPYIGYDGYGSSWVYESVIASPNYRLAPNRWAHLAGVFDAPARRLTLYVNGQMAGSRATAQIPFNGYVGGSPATNVPELVTDMMVTVGAADRDPAGVCDGSRDAILSGEYFWSGLQPGNRFPVLADGFAGCIDEVRCWDGARTIDQVRQAKDVAMTRRWVAQVNGITYGSENVYGGMGGSEMNPKLVYAYSFDSLVDPRERIVPEGFGQAIYPADWPRVEWWGRFPQASTVYNDRRYVKWIANLASHMPYDPPRDSKLATWLTPVSSNSVVTNFPNTSNPYVFEYIHYRDGGSESHPQYSIADSGLYGDLLPLGRAQGDDDGATWGGGDPGDPGADADGDGMPDTWELACFLDPADPLDAGDDPDGDGLTNVQEYQVGGDPWDAYSLDPGGALTDGEVDSDGDGLANGLEAGFGTRPDLPDTDDDGLRDGDELDSGTSPVSSLSPAVSRILRLNGGSSTWLEGPSGQSRFLLGSFTIGGWVRLNAKGGTVIVCQPDDASRNYRLRIRPDGVLEADFTALDRTNTVTLAGPGTAVVPTGVWTHVAAAFNPVNRRFALFRDGQEVAAMAALTFPTVSGYGPVRVTIGAGFNGDLDEVAIFGTALTPERILAWMNGGGMPADPAPVAFYPFDDGFNGLYSVSGKAGWSSGHVQDFAAVADDWNTGWSHGATLVGAAAVVGADADWKTGGEGIAFTRIGVGAGGVVLASVGDAGEGRPQALQVSTNLKQTNGWVTITTNAMPLPRPFTNWWPVSVTNGPAFFRIIDP